jgi:hypothetical protein
VFKWASIPHPTAGRSRKAQRWQFYLVAGIAVVSLLVAVGIYWLGNVTSARGARSHRRARLTTRDIDRREDY